VDVRVLAEGLLHLAEETEEGDQETLRADARGEPAIGRDGGQPGRGDPEQRGSERSRAGQDEGGPLQELEKGDAAHLTDLICSAPIRAFLLRRVRAVRGESVVVA